MAGVDESSIVGPLYFDLLYIHLRLVRLHVLRMYSRSGQVRLFSDPEQFDVADSGLHMGGPHYWSGPGLDTFHVRFHYLGAQARTSHHVAFQYHPFASTTVGFNTYLGRADGQDAVSSVAVYLRQGHDRVEYVVGPPPPPRPTPPALVDDSGSTDIQWPSQPVAPGHRVEGECWTIARSTDIQWPRQPVAPGHRVEGEGWTIAPLGDSGSF